MSTYPVLKVESLEDRCNKDIETFITQVLGGKSNSINSVRYKLYTGNDYNMMITEIGEQLTIMKKILHGEDITEFDYAHDILHFTEQERNQLWIVRTLLCYQMMIFGTHVMSDPSLHAKIYQTAPFQRPFRLEVVAELPSFKLGIFGSITPTSDIDIGIQYSGATAGFAALHYVVATMEDMFIYFLGVTSTLQLDIEYYADMMTLPNPNRNNAASPDLFYLDTTSFTKNEFKKMLPYAYASIYRNYLTAIKDLRAPRNDADFISRLQTYGVVVDNAAMDTAKTMVDSYMSLTYEKAREQYYEFVEKAEAHVAAIRGDIQVQNYGAITNDVIVNTMKAIAHALVFRAESYTCAPTVMHVVRLLQADPKQEKYPVTYPTATCEVQLKNRLKNPQCEIGRFGYKISRLEQIGYMLRFQMTYCEKSQNNANAKAKCDKKLKKYKTRLEDAILRENGIPDRNETNTQKNGVSNRKANNQRNTGSISMGGRQKKQYRTQRNLRKKYIKRTKKHTRR